MTKHYCHFHSHRKASTACSFSPILNALCEYTAKKPDKALCNIQTNLTKTQVYEKNPWAPFSLPTSV